jgi:hypothetical protein
MQAVFRRAAAILLGDNSPLRRPRTPARSESRPPIDDIG